MTDDGPTEKQLADRIHDAASELNNHLAEAAKQGLRIEVNTEELSLHGDFTPRVVVVAMVYKVL